MRTRRGGRYGPGRKESGDRDGWRIGHSARACATKRAREGAKVVVTDLEDTGGRDVVGKISSAGGETIYLHQHGKD